MHDAKDLIRAFDQCFFGEFNTVLIGGGLEPLYLPETGDNSHNRIIFTQDYFASALHEVAHWCIAGEARRKLQDFGYWYSPDGRSEQQQAEFEHMEVKPQALEWIFTESVGGRFRVSADNLSNDLGASDTFKQSIAKQAQTYCLKGIPERPRRFIHALQILYGGSESCDPALYRADRL